MHDSFLARKEYLLRSLSSSSCHCSTLECLISLRAWIGGQSFAHISSRPHASRQLQCSPAPTANSTWCQFRKRSTHSGFASIYHLFTFAPIVHSLVFTSVHFCSHPFTSAHIHHNCSLLFTSIQFWSHLFTSVNIRSLPFTSIHACSHLFTSVHLHSLPPCIKCLFAHCSPPLTNGGMNKCELRDFTDSWKGSTFLYLFLDLEYAE
jgi:hypothetical protein